MKTRKHTASGAEHPLNQSQEKGMYITYYNSITDKNHCSKITTVTIDLYNYYIFIIFYYNVNSVINTL